MGPFADGSAWGVEVQMSHDQLQFAASEMVLGMGSPEALPGIAAAALGEGDDSPSLRALAGLTEADTEAARSLFQQALAELSVELPPAREAAVVLAKNIAKEMLGGSITPYDGAKQIWELSLRLPEEHLPEFDTFIYGASEWADRPEDQNLFAEGIMAAARELTHSGA
jgi:hypothetical protein